MSTPESLIARAMAWHVRGMWAAINNRGPLVDEAETALMNISGELERVTAEKPSPFEVVVHRANDGGEYTP